MELKPGSRWKDAGYDVQMAVVRSTSFAGQLRCGGVAVLPQSDPCTKYGEIDPTHASGGRPLALKQAKPLSASA